MREIKFEYLIIHKPNKKVLKKYTFTLEDIENGKGSFALSSNTYLTKRQYTGLLDKNGVEIYEGDIVKIKYVSQPKEVKYSTVLASFLIGNDHRFTVLQDIEVIGNKYENENMLQ